MFLEKRGVARIGLRNQESIINKIKIYKINQGILFHQQYTY